MQMRVQFLRCKNVLLADVKNHPYFHGVDWEKVDARESEPPFEAKEIQSELGDPFDVRAHLKIFKADELEPSVAEKFQSWLIL